MDKDCASSCSGSKRSRQDDQHALEIIRLEQINGKCSEVEVVLSFILTCESRAKPLNVWSCNEVLEFLNGVPGRNALRERFIVESKITGLILSSIDECHNIHYALDTTSAEIPLFRMALRMASTFAKDNRFIRLYDVKLIFVT